MFVLGSIATVTLVWPMYALVTVALLAMFPHLGWLFLVLVTVPIWGRGIDSLQRRYAVTA
jgi:hypothetical protein